MAHKVSTRCCHCGTAKMLNLDLDSPLRSHPLTPPAAPTKAEFDIRLDRFTLDAKSNLGGSRSAGSTPLGPPLFGDVASKNVTLPGNPAQMLPYETHVDIPKAVVRTPSPPGFARSSSIGTDTESSTSMDSKTSSPQSTVAAFPGTMSSRNDKRRHHARAAHRRRQTQKKPTFGGRCKSIFKELFTYHPIDETQFEHMEDRQWMDDY